MAERKDRRYGSGFQSALLSWAFSLYVWWQSEIFAAEMVTTNNGMLRYLKLRASITLDSNDPASAKRLNMRKRMKAQVCSLGSPIAALWHTAMVMAWHCSSREGQGSGAKDCECESETERSRGKQSQRYKQHDDSA